jgi:hypothetical protein
MKQCTACRAKGAKALDIGAAVLPSEVAVENTNKIRDSGFDER